MTNDHNCIIGSGGFWSFQLNCRQNTLNRDNINIVYELRLFYHTVQVYFLSDMSFLSILFLSYSLIGCYNT